MGCVEPKTLADLNRGRLDEAEAARISAHLAGCAKCRSKSNRVQRVTDTLAVIADTMPPSLSAPSQARLEATLRWTRIETHPVRRFPVRRVGAWATAAAAAIAVAALGGRYYLHRGHEAVAEAPKPTAPVVAPVAPEAPVAAPGLRAVVTLVGGDVRLGNEAAPAPLRPTQSLGEGDRLIVAPGARVAFQWGEGSGAIVSGDSELHLTKLQGRAQELTLVRGQVAVRVGPHQPGESLRVVSPDHTVTVHGTWFVVAAEQGGTQVQVIEGVVEVGARAGAAATTQLRAPSRGFFPRDRGTPEGDRALSGKEAALLRSASEMGLLAWVGGPGGLDGIAAASGFLHIDSDPPAELVVDGVPFGHTPLELRRGRDRHLVELTRPGFAPVRRWVTVGEKEERLALELRADNDTPRRVAVELGPDEAQQVVAAHRRQVSACYQRALKRDPDLLGSVSLEIAIGPAGRVSSTKVSADTLQDREVTECLRREASTWRFKQARNVRIVYPFLFRTP